jgi:hypothetical protein
MASRKLLNYMRDAERELMIDDKNSLKNRPVHDMAFKTMQRKQQTGPGKYLLSDDIPRVALPKTSSIAPSVLQNHLVESDYQPGIPTRVVPTETQLLYHKVQPRGSVRDGIYSDSVSVPRESVIWEKPSDDSNDLWYHQYLRQKGVEQKLVSETFWREHIAVPLVWGVREPDSGNRLLEPRDSRLV